MFTSRAEYRLLLRQDNADRRLTPIGHRIGLVADDAWRSFQAKEAKIEQLAQELVARRHEGKTLAELLRRPEVEWPQILGIDAAVRGLAADADPRVVEQVVIETKYAGYIERQDAQIERFRRHEAKRIPEHFAYDAVPQLRHEAREKLSRIRPSSLGQASRISGISPADLAILMMYLDTPRSMCESQTSP
jgi:tRNA uridine 5-carboxymethylaminomethyl modification enzyme